MLRKLKIGTRVNVLIAVPLIALIVLAVVSSVSLQRASVGGDGYKQLKSAEKLYTDLVPPPANLLGSWSSVTKIAVLVASPVSAQTTGEIRAELLKLAESREDYFAAVAYWRAQPIDPAQKYAFDSGARSGEAFFEKVDSQLLPAVTELDSESVLAAVRAIESDYNIQQLYIASVLDLVEVEIADREQSTEGFVTTVQTVVIAAVGALLLLLLVVAFFVRRSIVRPILALSAQARRAATTDLPEAVRQIQSLPADAPMPTIERFHTKTRDELADLSESFNSVQSAALDLASEQAVARRVVSENLVNIARRTQSLLGRSLGSLSDMEETERDPDTLDRLFRLDHLTTRMRRNAQSLLVLAGAEQNRLWSPPVPLGDVVRAALSQIENYTRVDIGDLGDHALPRGDRALVQGALAPEVAHLLAELLENAASFSPPTTRVMVVGRSIANGHQLAIVDYGLGMSQEALDSANESLSRLEDFGAQSSKVLGFQVVARIAARLGIQVVLANTAGATGITAIIKLPAVVLDSRTAVPVTHDNGARMLPPPSGARHEPHLQAPGATVSSGATTSTAVVDDDRAVDDELWALADSIELSGPPADPGAPVEPSVATNPATRDIVPDVMAAIGLPKRVRGAQLPELGAALEDIDSWERPADEVRSSLSSLQRGTDMARQRRIEEQ